MIWIMICLFHYIEGIVFSVLLWLIHRIISFLKQLLCFGSIWSVEDNSRDWRFWNPVERWYVEKNIRPEMITAPIMSHKWIVRSETPSCFFPLPTIMNPWYLSTKSAHSNLASCVSGMMLGLVYYWLVIKQEYYIVICCNSVIFFPIYNRITYAQYIFYHKPKAQGFQEIYLFSHIHWCFTCFCWPRTTKNDIIPAIKKSGKYPKNISFLQER